MSEESQKSILIRNTTNDRDYLEKGGKKRVIILHSLRAKSDEPEIAIGPGQIQDLTVHGREKVINNAEIKLFVKHKCLELLDEYPEMNPEQKKKAIEDHKKNSIDDQIAELQGSTNLTELEDISNDDNLPVEVKFAALRRLQELDGDIEDAPELRDNPGQNHIIQ